MYKDIRRSTHKGSLYFYIWLFVMHRPSFNVVLDLVLRICGVPSSCLHSEVTAHKCSRQFPPFTGLPSLPQNNLSSTQADNGPIQHSLVYNFNFIVWKVASNPRIQIPRGEEGMEARNSRNFLHRLLLICPSGAVAYSQQEFPRSVLVLASIPGPYLISNYINTNLLRNYIT